jgi:ABC-type nitrate/sulfonate/bicarbonate transport system ATPase subunit
MFVTHDVAEAIVVGDVIVVMSPRPATVRRIIPVDAADRNRSSAQFAHKLGETLECLGVSADA